MTNSELIDIDSSKKEYAYKLTTDTLKDMGINGVDSNDKEGYYLVKYNLTDVTVEVYNTKGFTKDGKTYYSLSDLQKLQ